MTGAGELTSGPPYPASCTWSRARPELQPAPRPILGRKLGHQQESKVVRAPSSWEAGPLLSTRNRRGGRNVGVCPASLLRTSATEQNQQPDSEQGHGELCRGRFSLSLREPLHCASATKQPVLESREPAAGTCMCVCSPPSAERKWLFLRLFFVSWMEGVANCNKSGPGHSSQTLTGCVSC